MKRWPWRDLVWPLLALGVAYVLRTGTLTLQPLWVDEIYAAWYVDRPLLEAVHTIIQPKHNGPLYFLLLWLWQAICHTSDFALRYFSTLASVTTVALVWRLARDWFDARTAHLSALLVAMAPFAVYFGQETKMYALHMALATSTWLLLERALRRGGWKRWTAYLVSINLLAYTHYFGAFAVAAQALATLLVLRHRPRVLRTYVLSLAGMVIFYLPVLVFIASIFPIYIVHDRTQGFVPLGKIVLALMAEYGARFWWDGLPLYQRGAVLALVGLTGLGLVLAWRVRQRVGVWLTASVVLPVLIYYPISLQMPFFSPKYFSAMFPLLTLALALGVTWLLRRARWIGLGALALVLLFPYWCLLRDVMNPLAQRPNWRAIAAYLERNGSAEDVGLVFVDYAILLPERYGHGDVSLWPFNCLNGPEGEPYQPGTDYAWMAPGLYNPEAFAGTVCDPYAPEAYFDWLERQGYRHLWLILHHHEVVAAGYRLREVASARYPLITELYPIGGPDQRGEITVAGYVLNGRHTVLPADAQATQHTFTNGLVLRGYRVETTRLEPISLYLHPPAAWLHVVSYWGRTSAAVTVQGAPSFTLRDAEGRVWGASVTRARDPFILNPPDTWDAQTLVETHADVQLDPHTPPGRYALYVAWGEGEAYPLTEIEVLPVPLVR